MGFSCIYKQKENFFFNGWSQVVLDLGLKQENLLVFNPVNATTFKISYFIDGVLGSSFSTWLTSADSHFSVIPKAIVAKYCGYTSTNVNATIYIANKMFDVKIERIRGQVGFTKGLDVVVDQFLLDSGCYLIFMKLFGNFFRLIVFVKNRVELNSRT
ncbi:hypothetical protein Hanom_Chr05g00391881 [Helianthus anomalus]